MKSKNKYLLSLAIYALYVLTMSVPVQAQLFKAFVSGGFTVAQIDGDEVYGFKHLGVNTGIGVIMPLNPNTPNEGFQLSTEILFVQKGAKNTNIFDPFIYKATLNYIEIPFMLHYFDKRAGAALGAGIQYGRLIKSSEIWELSDTLIPRMDRPLVTDNHYFIKNDLCFVADFRFNIYRNFKFDVRWQYSLLPIRKDFTFCNSYNELDEYYKTWNRDFKNNYVSFKLIYVINEKYDTYKTKTRRKTAY